MIKITSDVDLQSLHTLRLNARAQALVWFEDRAQLPALLALAREYQQVNILAGGSNIVFNPQVSGLLIGIRTRGIALVEETSQNYYVEVEAGECWHDFVLHCLRQGWHGLENLALIPGTVGAAPMQNIGAYGVEVERFVVWVEVLDWRTGEVLRMSRQDCAFAYRDSVFKQERGRWLILKVHFAFPKQWQAVLDYPDLQHAPELQEVPTPTAIFQAVCRIRQEKLPDPQVLPNAGSFFKNPIVTTQQAADLRVQWPDLRAFPHAPGQTKLAAGWLLDQAGWKGRCIGPVGMHKKQALVLVNHQVGQAAKTQVDELIKQIQKDMQARYGLQLEQEPVVI